MKIEFAPGFQKSWDRLFSLWYLPYRIFSWIKRSPREVKYAYQRVVRGYDDTCHWSLNFYLAERISVECRTLAENCNGCTEELFDNTNKEDQCWKWKAILIEIAEGFEAYIKHEEDGPFDNESYDKMKVRLDHSFDLLKKWYPNLWD